MNDPKARDFGELTKLCKKGDFQQALGIPKNTGKPIQYAGSTTGPAYNEQGSPFQISWSVGSKVAKLNIEPVGK
nr:delta-class carbonic anhydrase [uncultured Undibacterium sp.]